MTKILNAYIVHELNARQKNPPNNFKLKICLFAVTNRVKNGDKKKMGVQWLWNSI